MKASLLLCLVFCLLKITSGDIKIKGNKEATDGENGNPLNWFILKQINAFGNKIDKLNNNDIQTEKEIHKLEKELDEKSGKLAAKIDTFDTNKQQQILSQMKNIKDIKTFEDKSEKKILQLQGNLKGLTEEFKARKSSADIRMNGLQTQINNAFKKASEARLGCQSGVYGKHDYPQVRFPANTYIRFNPPFPHTPSVVYGLYLLDSNRHDNVRVSTGVSNLSKNGFSLSIGTFSGTTMWGARISWMACPKEM